MKKNIFVIEEEETDNAVYSLGRAESSIENTKRDFPYRFSGMKRSGLFANGVDKINKQMENITNTIFNVKEKIKRHSYEVFEMERLFDKYAQEIEIPQDFVKNDSTQVNTIDDIYLSKNDGRSVNEGTKIDEVNNLNDYDLESQKLESIVSNNGVKEEKYDSDSSVTKEEMDNINNNKSTEEVNVDEESTIEANQLETINNNNSLQNIDYDDSINLEKVSIKEANENEDLEEEDFEDFMDNNYEMDVLDNDNKG